MKNKTDGNWLNFLSLASYSFLAIGMEIILIILVEPLFFNTSLEKITTVHSIFHWVMTIIIWILFAYYLTKRSISKYNFNFLKSNVKMKKRDWVFAIGIILTLFIVSYVSWEGFKVLKEFQRLGFINFVFQYIYYLVESLLVLLIIVFAQKAGEIKFGKSNVPWGGIFAGLTWGMVNTIVQGSPVAGIIGLFYGMLYLVAHENFKITYLLIAIAFII